MKNILITGAGGYIGIPLTSKLLDEGYCVTALDRYFFGSRLLTDNLKDRARLRVLQDDIRNLNAGHFEGIDAVIDLAGLSNDPTCDFDPKLTTDINAYPVEKNTLLAKKSGVSRYIYFSSCSIYGVGNEMILDENSDFSPVSEYARSKIFAEAALFDKHSDTFTTVSMRNATVFGLAPRMRFDLVVNIMTKIALQQRRLYILGGGEQWRPLVHVNDLVEATSLMIKADKSLIGAQAYNVGGSKFNYKVADIAKIVEAALPFDVEIVKTPDDADKRSYRVDFTKIKTTLGFEPKLDIQYAVNEIMCAAERSELNLDDIRWNTLAYYKKLQSDFELLESVKMYGGILSQSTVSTAN